MTSSTTTRMSSPSRFPGCALTYEEEVQYRKTSKLLLKRAIAECEATLGDIDGYWKYSRTHGGSLKIYKASQLQAPSQLMATGIISGNLYDVMSCMHAENSFDFRMNSALLMPKEHLDCEVLHVADTEDATHPFRFLGLKWCATKWPTLSKSRDMCYIESTGITQSKDKNGQLMEYGYVLMESVELDQCRSLDEFSICRAKISVRHIFRELPIGCTLVMTHCSVDPGGSLWLNDLSSLPQLVSVSRASECAESIRLSHALMSKYPQCTSPTEEGGAWSRLIQKSHSQCALCNASDHKTHQRKRIVQYLGTGIKTTKKYFCQSCLMKSSSISPSFATKSIPSCDLDVDFFDELVRFSSVESTSLSTLRSTTLSDSMDTTTPPTSLPILDFDDDDDEDDIESIYTPMNIRTVVPYSPGQSYKDQSPSSCNSTSPQAIAFQLMQLNIQMNDTLNVVRRNQSHADMFRRELEVCNQP